MATRILSTVLLLLAALLLSSCSDNESNSDSDSDKVTDIVQNMPDDTGREADIEISEPDQKSFDVEMDESSQDAPPYAAPCEEGEVQCKYNNKAERICIEFDGEWVWDIVESCDAGTTCIEGIGCTCDLGGCTDQDLSSCQGPLGVSEVWGCVDACCIPLENPDHCPDSSHCQDCIQVETEEQELCPDGPSDGMILNLCTQDICDNGLCIHAEKSCDDGDACTVDTCDVETGECVIGSFGLCQDVYCWGASEEEAQGKCFDNNLCTLDSCDLGEEFVAWDSADDPQFNPACTEEHPDWPDCDPKPPNVYSCKNEPKSCDDFDICTIDSCDQETGCQHECDWEAPCYLGCMDNDCLDDDLCTDEYFAEDIQLCAYEPKDCNDYDPCTEDSCDSIAGCQHIGEPCPVELCLPADLECDDGNPCTEDYCDFAPGDEFGYCEHAEIECDTCGCCDYGAFCSQETGKCECPNSSCQDEVCATSYCDCELGCIYDTKICVHPDDPKCFNATCYSADGIDPKCNFEPVPPPYYGPCTVAVCNQGKFTFIADPCTDTIIVQGKQMENLCTVDSCNMETGACEHEPKDCLLGDNCLESSSCDPATGACEVMEKNCDDENQCTTDACHPLSGDCLHLNKPLPTDLCNSYSCNPITGAIISEPVSCSDGDNCTFDSCDENFGCTHAPDPACGGCIDANFLPDDDECEDGNLCTINTCVCQVPGDDEFTCLDAACASTQVFCEDTGPPGSSSTCNPITGECEYILKNCSDGDQCTIDSTAEEGKCLHEQVLCDDNDACTENHCVPVAGCFNQPINVEAVCGDSDPCTVDSCDPAQGCQNIVKDCDDNDACTEEFCNDDGLCEYQFINCFYDDNDCTVDSCDSAIGCVHEPDDSLPCSDGDPETENACVDGVCVVV
jgi:hypothetical protein